MAGPFGGSLLVSSPTTSMGNPLACTLAIAICSMRLSACVTTVPSRLRSVPIAPPRK